MRARARSSPSRRCAGSSSCWAASWHVTHPVASALRRVPGGRPIAACATRRLSSPRSDDWHYRNGAATPTLLSAGCLGRSPRTPPPPRRPASVPTLHRAIRRALEPVRWLHLSHECTPRHLPLTFFLAPLYALTARSKSSATCVMESAGPEAIEMVVCFFAAIAVHVLLIRRAAEKSIRSWQANPNERMREATRAP